MFRFFEIQRTDGDPRSTGWVYSPPRCKEEVDHFQECKSHQGKDKGRGRKGRKESAVSLRLDIPTLVNRTSNGDPKPPPGERGPALHRRDTRPGTLTARKGQIFAKLGQIHWEALACEGVEGSVRSRASLAVSRLVGVDATMVGGVRPDQGMRGWGSMVPCSSQGPIMIGGPATKGGKSFFTISSRRTGGVWSQEPVIPSSMFWPARFRRSIA